MLKEAGGRKIYFLRDFIFSFGRKNFSLLDVVGAWEEKLFPPWRCWRALGGTKIPSEIWWERKIFPPRFSEISSTTRAIPARCYCVWTCAPRTAREIINQIAVGENLVFETKHRPLNLQCLAEFVFHKISFFKITKRRRESTDIAINTLQNPGKI